MTLIFEQGAPDMIVGPETMRRAVGAVLDHLGDASRMLVLPPDGSRFHSGAGTLTQRLWEGAGQGGVFDVMPMLARTRP